MAKVPGFAKAFAGRWRIVEMDNWDSAFLNLVEQAHLTFEGKSDGEIAFGALKGFLDVRYGARDGSACAEFSWEGHDDNDPACGALNPANHQLRRDRSWPGSAVLFPWNTRKLAKLSSRECAAKVVREAAPGFNRHVTPSAIHYLCASKSGHPGWPTSGWSDDLLPF